MSMILSQLFPLEWPKIQGRNLTLTGEGVAKLK